VATVAINFVCRVLDKVAVNTHAKERNKTKKKHKLSAVWLGFIISRWMTSAQLPKWCYVFLSRCEMRAPSDCVINMANKVGLWRQRYVS